MKQYLEILEEIFEKGVTKPPARDNMPPTESRFSIQKRFDMADGFPLVTTKKMFYKGMVHELIWFLRGDTNISYLHKNKIKKFWHEDAYGFYKRTTAKDDTHVRTFDEWCAALDDEEYAKKFGDTGLIYPHQWRNWEGKVDQIDKVLENIKKNPDSRYHVVTAWNPSEMTPDKAALPPCHMLFMFNCRPMSVKERFDWWGRLSDAAKKEGHSYRRKHNIVECTNYLDRNNIPSHYLDLDLTQRSCDTPLGVPVNIASYALLLHIFAKLTGMAAGEFIWCGKDVHIYKNQIDLAKKQLKREPLPLPQLDIVGDWKTIDDVNYDDIVLSGYQHHEEIKYPLSTGIVKD